MRNRQKTRPLEKLRRRYIKLCPESNMPATGKTPETIAAICQVDLSTARRWKAGVSRIPYTAAVLLVGDLGAFSKHWNSWKIQGEDLVSPDGWTINRNHALSLPLMLGQLSARDADIRSLKAQIAELEALLKMEEQPSPSDEIPAILA